MGVAEKPAQSSFPRRRESIAILIVDGARIAGMIYRVVGVGEHQ